MAYDLLPEEIDFNQHVKPILSDKCFICHGPDKAKVKAGLQLHLPEFAYDELKDSPGEYAIKPGNLAKSQTVARILSDDPDYQMPKPDAHLSLSNYEKAMLIKWIEEGAEYKDHWAFSAPEKYAPPKVELQEKVANPIDNFVLAKLEGAQLIPNDKADKETLLRRLTFDLTGLPPDLQEMDNFLADDSPYAYEKQVDRLLASPHYGEQMTFDWLDLARYADTHGYTVDRYRDVSPWRDWVIKAFNENMPYDKFIQWQIAGDMMPDATQEQILATTFNRLHPQNGEGGIIDEEFRSEYVADRTNTLGQGLLGLTVACAKCHDHKYDPISQKNYYEMYSFFNNVNESGQISFDYSMPAPNLMLPNEEQEKFLKYIEALIGEEEKKVKEMGDAEVPNIKEWISTLGYQKINPDILPTGLLANFDFNSGQLRNTLNLSQKGRIRRQYANDQKVNLVSGFDGNGLKLDGDAWLHLDNIGNFQRHQSFSIGIRIHLPEELESGVIFHKGVGAKLYNFRGYHLALNDNKLELVLAHLHPANAIIVRSLSEVPKNKWVQLTMTYNGNSKASGLKIFMDGQQLPTKTVTDNLYKDISFNSNAYGVADVPNDPGLQIGARWRGKGIGGAIVDDILVFDKELSKLEVLQISRPEQLTSLLTKSNKELTEDEVNVISDYFLANKSKNLQTAKARLEQLKKVQVDSMDRVQEIMVMKEMAIPRASFILERGLYDVYGEQVFPNTPQKIFPYPDSLPKNRLGLAKWVTHRQNPLTARVAVNRYWQHLFGMGIVRTAEDFGNQGEMPSHPKLLDWLAIHFIESGWDVKALHKLMVMSNTYQQSSLASDQQKEKDKYNRLLARGPSKRLTGEMLRNNALAASGLLNKKIGGPSVKPYQPKGLWKINGAAYEVDKGDKLYRKSMYTIWKRSVPHPTIATFDAPERSYCVVRRQETNTPLQALVMLNDPTYVEAARALGNSMVAYTDIKDGITTVFRKLTGRTILPDELQLLVNLREEELVKFKVDKSKTEGWLSSGMYRISKQADGVAVAANAVVASTILNSDATITKR
ncbi:DUF1553 domain-containing protein [Muriicola sp. Z0-33]|nr:DUF1553 domain-containing protein [Muriicola sp. Z0-33]